MIKSLKNQEHLKVDFDVDVDVEKCLTEEGVGYSVSSDNWLILNCLYPDHEDKNPSFFIHRYHGGFNCYGCLRHGSWDVLCKDMGWETDEDTIILDTITAREWDSFERELTQSDVEFINKMKMPRGMRRIKKHHKKFYNYLVDRNMDGLVDEFDINFTNEFDAVYGSIYKNRIIVVVHDHLGRPIFAEGRTILKNKRMKYYRPKGAPKGNLIFNYFRVIRDRYNWVVVVEGIFDAMTLWSYGVPGVSILGTAISERQMSMLMSFDRIYFALDNDKAGNTSFGKLIDRFAHCGTDIYRTVLPRGKDFNDLNYRKAIRVINNSRKIY